MLKKVSLLAMLALVLLAGTVIAAQPAGDGSVEWPGSVYPAFEESEILPGDEPAPDKIWGWLLCIYRDKWREQLTDWEYVRSLVRWCVFIRECDPSWRWPSLPMPKGNLEVIFERSKWIHETWEYCVWGRRLVSQSEFWRYRTREEIKSCGCIH